MNAAYQVGAALGLAAMTAVAASYGANRLGDPPRSPTASPRPSAAPRHRHSRDHPHPADTAIGRDGRLVSVRSAKKDPGFRKSTVTDAEFDRNVRNIYKVLLTRGMIGTVLYSTDEETREFLASLLPGSS